MTGGKVQCQGTKGGIKCKGGWSEGVVVDSRVSVRSVPSLRESDSRHTGD